MPRRRPDPPTTGAAAHLERRPRWAGISAGEPVRVAGTRLRAASWTFVAHVRNTRTAEEWVEVVGGRPGDRAVRSFRTEQILPATARRGGEPPPLATAPQLPLG